NEERIGAPDGLFPDDTVAALEPGSEASQWCRGFVLGHGWLEDEWVVEGEEEDRELARAMMTISFFVAREVAEEFTREASDGRRSVGEIASTFRTVWPDALSGYAALGRRILRRRMEERR